MTSLLTLIIASSEVICGSSEVASSEVASSEVVCVSLSVFSEIRNKFSSGETSLKAGSSNFFS